MNNQKTYKREVAGGMFGLYALLVAYSVFEPSAASAVETTTLPVFGFGGAAFLGDAVIKHRQGGM